jgi:glyoxylase-like metal-dependent hydrolase (beta-lactamase superfamily II)
MQIMDLGADLRMLVGSPGQAYLFRRGEEITLIDTGAVGCAGDIAAALRDWGADTSALRRVVLTHWHADHAGSAAEIGSWPGVEVLAHRLDAPVIRGQAAGAEPVFTDAERALHAQVAADLPPAPPARVDRELEDGDMVDGLGARVIATPGHTDGSIALYLPDERVLFTGDVAAHAQGHVILGPFNTDRVLAAASFRRFADLPAEAVCFGHGDPLTGAAAGALAEAAGGATVPDPLG